MYMFSVIAIFENLLLNIKLGTCFEYAGRCVNMLDRYPHQAKHDSSTCICAIHGSPDIHRLKLDQWMRALDTNHVMPEVEEGETIFEYFVNLSTFQWEK